MLSLEDLKLPPHNIDAEKALLSSVFLDNMTMEVCENTTIKHIDFYKKEHQCVYEAMTVLKQKFQTIDTITVADQLTKKDQLDSLGGMDYLYDLATYAMTSSSAGVYATIVKEKAVLRHILTTCQQIIGEVYEQKETEEILNGIEKRIFDLTQTQFGNKLVHIRDILDPRVEQYMAIVDNPGIMDVGKVLSNYPKMDDMLGGFKPGELIILAARPSMGKTAISLNFLINAAITQKKSVALFSLEMTKELIVDRIVSTVSSIPMYKISKGDLDQDDFVKMGEATAELGDARIYIDDMGGATVGQIKSKLRRLKIETGQLDMVIIDYLQLISGQGNKYDGNRVQEISMISRGLKELSKELSIPIIALSQLSRGVEQRIDKRPQLSDLRESGAIEQDADVVMMIYREEYYDPDTADKKGLTEILIRKNRNGPVGDVALTFNAPTMRFLQAEDQRNGYSE